MIMLIGCLISAGSLILGFILGAFWMYWIETPLRELRLRSTP